ncbi:hypothetical protein FBU30_008933 [Linnemannia zychae]|nr:hypothetical protein FBU30_008933 [Linnemannia zychae]
MPVVSQSLGSPLLAKTNSSTIVPKPPLPHLIPFPPWLKWPIVEKLAITPRYKPIYSTDRLVQFIVDIPANTAENDVTLVFGDDSTKFKSPVHVGTNIISVPRSYISSNLTTVVAVVGSNEAKADFTMYQAPKPGTSNTVRVDYFHGSLVPQQQQELQSGSLPLSAQPVFPFGMYASFSSFGAKDPIGAIKELKEMGINHVNFVPPYENGDKIKALLTAAQDAGLYLQYDMRHTYMDSSKVTAEVNSMRGYSSLGTWYTSDEPDSQAIAPEPKSSYEAYRTINSIDPHHPVMLVLNTFHDNAAKFSGAADILMTDVYPIGLNPRTCILTSEGGCCGCIGCVGDMATDIRRRLVSYRSQLAKIGRPRLPVWMVLQAFSDPKTCWSRAPTAAEYRLMSYVSLIYGARGIMGWIYPTGLTPELKESLPALSGQLVPLASRFILGGTQELEYTDPERQIAAGVWTVTTAVMDGGPRLLFIIANTANNWITLDDLEVAKIFGSNSAAVTGLRVIKPLGEQCLDNIIGPDSVPVEACLTLSTKFGFLLITLKNLIAFGPRGLGTGV